MCLVDSTCVFPWIAAVASLKGDHALFGSSPIDRVSFFLFFYKKNIVISPILISLAMVEFLCFLSLFMHVTLRKVFLVSCLNLFCF